MRNIEKKFALDDTLNQIYNNNYYFDFEYIHFLFYNANFILLNDVYLYIPKKTCTDITLTTEYMKITISELTWEIKYKNIKDFSIHFEE